MKIKTCIPDQLPLRKLQWDQLADLTWRAHATLTRFNELLLQVKNPERVFSVLTYLESVSSLHSQQINSTLPGLLKYAAQETTNEDGKLCKLLYYREALLYGMKRIKKSSFSFELICELHRIARQDLPRGKAGKFRDKQNWIGPEGCSIEEAYFYPPKVETMKKSMENLKEYFFDEEKDPLVQLAIFFAQFLVIHPFMDGNGRVGRILIPLFLYKKKLLAAPLFFLSRYFKKHRLQYFEKLFEISSKDAWIEWIRYFLQGVIHEGEIQIRYTKRLLQLYQSVNKEMGYTLENQKVIDHLFESPIIQAKSLQGSKKVIEKLQRRKWIKIDKTQSMIVMESLLTIDRE